MKPTEIGARERTGGPVEIGDQAQIEEPALKGGAEGIDGLAGVRLKIKGWKEY